MGFQSTKWELVNASHWAQLQSENSVTYFSVTLPNPPVDWQNHFKPFATVTFQNETGTLQARRDHFGQEPFYYCLSGNRFLFGSSLGDIIRALGTQPQPNLSLIQSDLTPQTLPSYSNETYYEGIFRVEPGHVLTVKEGKVQSEAYWSVDPEAPRIEYGDPSQYVEHFGELMKEAVLNSLDTEGKLAAEVSGGLDSSAVLVACHAAGLKPALYTHIAPRNSEEVDNLAGAHAVCNGLSLGPLKEVGNEDFDLIAALHRTGMIFSGGIPYIFFLLAHNLHQTVQRDGIRKLLSGFGGDECVSGHAFDRAFFPQLMRSGLYGEAWRQKIDSFSEIKFLCKLVRYKYPALEKIAARLKNRQPEIFYKSLQHREADLLCGPGSHHLRMRIEYSAVAAKALGFSYGYPLLYPKLVEFYSRLPWQMKRKGRVKRYLIRQYLTRHLPHIEWQTSSKRAGLFPAGAHLAKTLSRQGTFETLFKDLPFSETLSSIPDEKQQLYAKLRAYLFKEYGRV